MTLLRFLTLALLVCCGHAEATLTRGALDAKVDALVTEGEEHPAQAIAALTQLQREHSSTIDERRMLLLALGSVEAMAGRAAQAAAFAELLLTLAADDASGRALAASNLVRADIAYVAGQHDLAAALAQSALPAFMAGCAPPSGSAASQPPAPAATCDYRPAWHALELLELRARAKGLPAAQATHARTALGLAEAAGDLARQARNLSSLAQLAQARGEHDAARQFMARARRLVQQGNEPAERARFYNADAGLAEIRGDSQAALQARQAALAAAVLADAPRLEARMLNNLSDAYSRLGRPADALRAAERAMPIVRRHNDVRVERLLIVNIGIAKIRLGRIAEGKQDLARVLELWHQSGETGFEVETLVDFGEALAVAGDARGAVELFHRERALSAEMMKRNRSVALKELQTRNEAQARQRDIELLGRDNALKTEALATRDLTQRIWWVLAAVMALAIAVVALLYRRMREANRRLAASHLQLQAQSDRDPLTNLANRRHFQSVMARLSAAGGFEGALLLVDIDHFKHVNDAHGHAAGDQVLIEVARRLNQAVRGDDLVVRWGGEEFLILAPRAAPEQADQMAARVLRAFGATPIQVDGAALRVTASIGYARFPLPPYNAPVPWEQAVNLADMALYTAKNQGRNRAFGIGSTTAATREALCDIERDFDRAWHEGRVTLTQTPGAEAQVAATEAVNAPVPRR